jgi:signal transduction histidine kinase
METSQPSHWVVDRRAVLAVIAALMGLTVLDALLGTRLLGVARPAAAADLAVLGAVVVAMAVPPRYRLVACCAAAAASIGVSRGVAAWQPLDYSPVMGRGAWPGIAEFAGIGFLAGWCIRTSRRAGAIGAAASLAAGLAAVWVWRQNGPYGWLVAVLLAAAWAIVVLAGLYLRWLDVRQDETTMLVRQEERIAIARELHDMVAHHVTGIVVQAQAARLVASDRPDVASRSLEAIEQAGGEALSAMRRLVGSPRDDSAAIELQPLATVADLRAIAAPPARGEIPVRLAIDQATTSLPTEVLASVHRIAREAVTNARRHASGATAIDVDVRCRDGLVLLQVRNDGFGASRPPGGGFGLTGMAERAAALGGRFHAGPLPAGGWRVAAELPVG